ncbi:nucleoside kinase [bacterium]|nr:nucleoside kinase [bacterium]
MLNVKFKGKKIKVEKGTTVLDFLKKIKYKSKFKPLGAFFNNELVNLAETIKRDVEIKIANITSIEGMKIYSTSLSFVLFYVTKKMFPKDNLIVQHSLAGGLYLSFERKKFVSFKNIQKIKRMMKRVIKEDRQIVKEVMGIEDGIEYFKSIKDHSKTKFLQQGINEQIPIYSLGKNMKTYFYGPLVPSTGYLGLFNIISYPGGLVLFFPTPSSPNKIPEFREQKKVFSVFHEYEDWKKVLNVNDVGSLNETIRNGQISQIVKISEVIHEKKISYIADEIKNDKNIKLILIAGPSASGKTTFTKRLSIHLQVNGIKTAMISLDDYFLPREKTPKDRDGNYDFEHIDAIDIELFNNNLMSLIEGEEVEIPEFDFKIGRKKAHGEKLKLENNQVILIEGIHGLDPKLTYYIPDILKYKIYVSALTQLNVDSHNRIPTTDTRKIRRMVRDFHFRKYGAEDTLKRWDSIRRGEARWIFPFQENADAMFNSALIYELATLKDSAVMLLREISPDSEVYFEARRLLNFLSYFFTLPPKEIPPTSVLREFLGSSSFHY